MSYSTILYAVDGPTATITLNRPESLNTIVPPMPDEVQDAVTVATRDSAVKVIVLRGAGRAFCAGYDLGGGFRHWDELITTEGRLSIPKIKRPAVFVNTHARAVQASDREPTAEPAILEPGHGEQHLAAHPGEAGHDGKGEVPPAGLPGTVALKEGRQQESDGTVVAHMGRPPAPV